MKAQLKKLADVDIGRAGTPGSAASEICCQVFVSPKGRYRAVGSASTGCNQGHYQANYRFGPWEGRGDTAKEAVDDMIARADDDWQSDMQKAGHDALIAIEDEEEDNS